MLQRSRRVCVPARAVPSRVQTTSNPPAVADGVLSNTVEYSPSPIAPERPMPPRAFVVANRTRVAMLLSTLTAMRKAWPGSRRAWLKLTATGCETAWEPGPAARSITASGRTTSTCSGQAGRHANARRTRARRNARLTGPAPGRRPPCAVRPAAAPGCPAPLPAAAPSRSGRAPWRRGPRAASPCPGAARAGPEGGWRT